MMLFIFFLILIVFLIGTGLYMMCETGNVLGFALVVGGSALGGGVAAGFGL
jgi:hypothetical protein